METRSLINECGIIRAAFSGHEIIVPQTARQSKKVNVMMTAQSKNVSPPSNEEIRHQLESLLASPDFAATPQQVSLLRYVVNQTLSGKADSIKGYTVATEVFGRRTDFNQNIDPIVSIQAGRLRRALSHYYQGPGLNDRVIIDIPKGSYVPVFETHRQPGAKPAAEPAPAAELTPNHRRYWPTVLVRTVRNLSGDTQLDNWRSGLAAELANELNRYPDIRIMNHDPENGQGPEWSTSPRFAVDGSVRCDQDGIKLILSLADAQTGRQLWSNAYRSAVDDGNSIAFQERVARKVSVALAGKRGLIAETLGREIHNGLPPGSEAYMAVLRHYDYISTATPEAFQRALAALEKAAAVDPECGQVWTMRGRLFASMHAFDIPGFDKPLDRAMAFALKGMRLMPGDQRAHGVLALIHLLRDDLDACRVEAERALHLAPETLFILDGIGYVLTLMGDWEQGPALIRKAIDQNPFYSNYVHFALWVDCLRQKDCACAYIEAMKLNRPASFWDHLAKAATFGLCGNIEDGRRAAGELLNLKPDFPRDGRRLIGHYIKFEDIADRVVEGLAAVGVQIQ